MKTKNKVEPRAVPVVDKLRIMLSKKSLERFCIECKEVTTWTPEVVRVNSEKKVFYECGKCHYYMDGHSLKIFHRN